MLPRKPNVNTILQKKRYTTNEQNLSVCEEKEVNHKLATYTQFENRITWTAEDDATIVSMIAGGYTYAKIA